MIKLPETDLAVHHLFVPNGFGKIGLMGELYPLEAGSGIESAKIEPGLEVAGLASEQFTSMSPEEEFAKSTEAIPLDTEMSAFVGNVCVMVVVAKF